MRESRAKRPAGIPSRQTHLLCCRAQKSATARRIRVVVEDLRNRQSESRSRGPRGRGLSGRDAGRVPAVSCGGEASTPRPARARNRRPTCSRRLQARPSSRAAALRGAAAVAPAASDPPKQGRPTPARGGCHRQQRRALRRPQPPLRSRRRGRRRRVEARGGVPDAGVGHVVDALATGNRARVRPPHLRNSGERHVRNDPAHTPA